jgi:hypothetical protein
MVEGRANRVPPCDCFLAVSVASLFSLFTLRVFGCRTAARVCFVDGLSWCVYVDVSPVGAVWPSGLWLTLGLCVEPPDYSVRAD